MEGAVVGYTPGMPPAHAPALDLVDWTWLSVLLGFVRKFFRDKAGPSPGANCQLTHCVFSSLSYISGHAYAGLAIQVAVADRRRVYPRWHGTGLPLSCPSIRTRSILL